MLNILRTHQTVFHSAVVLFVHGFLGSLLLMPFLTLYSRSLQKQKEALEFPKAGVIVHSKLTSPCFQCNHMKYKILRTVVFLILFLHLIGEQLCSRLRGTTFVFSFNSLEKPENPG